MVEVAIRDGYLALQLLAHLTVIALIPRTPLRFHLEAFLPLLSPPGLPREQREIGRAHV